MQLVFASRNPDKIAELRDALNNLPLEIRSAAEFPGVPEVDETGTTLEANALLKARAVHRATHCLCLADDTGLEVEALGGAPGVHSARFGGREQSYEKNLAKLLEALRGVPEAQRGARFRTVVATVFPDGAEVVVEGVCAGRILSQRRGSGGFGYDPVFCFPEAGKTFAEMSLAEKQRISHRGHAMRKARVILEEWLRTSGKR
ncbi:MAG: XTP/dITP diphosphatase [Candidatus Eisenbacteria sp.]|nr:XTP/dITP diphosphatase [Candidatus Eisenbacteria bacterium]